ncbi:MAG TPA: YfhO family protein [Thermoanaerobaculia bacterium]|nr:YfhO family protein [Thermoanaerobaculia bacterium]
MSLLLYAATAALLLLIVRGRISRGAALVLFLLPFCFVGRALLTDSVYGPVDLPYVTEPLKAMRVPMGMPEIHNGVISDLYAQMIPWRKAVQYAYGHGQWPLWNPFILSGSVLAASAQPAVYSPFTLLALLLPVAKGLTFSAAITLFLAGLGAFLFARELGCRESVALFAAAGWMYAKALAFFLLWAIGGAWALFPLVMLGTRRCVRAPSIRSAALLCIALVLILFAGHPETVLHAVFVGAVYGVVELARVRRDVVRALAAAAGAGVVAFGLTAIYILPILEAAPQTSEHAFRVDAWSKMSHAVTNREAAARMLTDVFAYLHGHRWEWGDVHSFSLDTTAVGSIVLGMAIFALWRIRSGDTWFLGGLALFGFLSRAAWKPLSDAVQKLPMFDITINERFAFAGAFALVMLAALGLEWAVERRDRAFGFTLAAALVAYLIGDALLRHAGIVSMQLNDWGRYAWFGEVGCLALAALVAVLRPPGRVLVPLLVGVLLLQHVYEEGDIYPTLPARAAYPPIPMFAPMKDAKEPFRIVAHAHGFIPGTAALYELEDVRGYEALTFARYIETYRLWCVAQSVWFNRIDEFKPFLSFLNVRFSIAGDAPVPAGWHVAATQRGAQLFENDRVIERAFLPRHVRVGVPEGDALNEMADATDFRETAWIEAPLPRQEFANGTGRIHIERAGNGFHIDADMDTNGWMVISEPAWKGWRAYLDERRVQMFFANEAFLGLHVPAGHHTIRLVFLPDGFVRGRAISLVTLLFVIGLTLRNRLASRMVPQAIRGSH